MNRIKCENIWIWRAVPSRRAGRTGRAWLREKNGSTPTRWGFSTVLRYGAASRTVVVPFSNTARGARMPRRFPKRVSIGLRSAGAPSLERGREDRHQVSLGVVHRGAAPGKTRRLPNHSAPFRDRTRHDSLRFFRREKTALGDDSACAALREAGAEKGDGGNRISTSFVPLLSPVEASSATWTARPWERPR